MSLRPNPVAGTSGIEDREQGGVDLLGRNPIRTQVLKFSTDPKEKLEKVKNRIRTLNPELPYNQLVLDEIKKSVG